MRQMLLAMTPVLLFVSAILVGLDDSPPEPVMKGKIPIAAYTPPPAGAEPPDFPEIPEQEPETVPAEPDQETPQNQPASPPRKLADVKICSDSYGTTAYETAYGTQVQPVLGSSAQCEGPVAILREGRTYFGCPDGKIILDCDWFMDELRTESVLFGESSVADFSVPDTSALECSEGQVEEAILLTVGGKVCDLETLVGNINQMHGS
ncbi:MAG: hypothetical protein AB1324_03830 [Candidatus Micrarchaeota archaeon]